MSSPIEHKTATDFYAGGRSFSGVQYDELDVRALTGAGAEQAGDH